MKGRRLVLFEAMAQDRPSVWAAYEAWKQSGTHAERMKRAYDLACSLEVMDVGLARAWIGVLEELGWFASDQDDDPRPPCRHPRTGSA